MTSINDDTRQKVDRRYRDHVFEQAIGVLMQRHDSSLHESTAYLRHAAEILGVDAHRLGRFVLESTNLGAAWSPRKDVASVSVATNRCSVCPPLGRPV